MFLMESVQRNMIDMDIDVENILKSVVKYQHIDTNGAPLIPLEIDYNKELIVVVGDVKYPQRSNNGSAINASAFPVYSNYGFSEVAFLCDRKTIELFSIIGIFFDSIDKAALLIAELLNRKLMDAFAKCLFFDYNVMLVNANGSMGSLDNLLSAFKNHKVLFCWGKKKGYGITFLANLNKSKTNGRFDFFIRLKHPSSHSYRSGYENACSCYMDRTYDDKMSNLTIQSFKIF